MGEGELLIGAWAAYIGPGDEVTLRALLGPDAQTCTGPGYGLGAGSAGGGEPATIEVAGDGSATASIGHADGGCAATIAAAGPTLTLTRDPFGFYGVYTAHVDGVLWCASDARMLQRLPGAPDRLDPSALHGYLCFSYVPAPLTLVSGVAALPAGSRLVMTPHERRCEATAAWQEAAPLEATEAASIGELRARLRAAVARRLGAEREVGVFLSGGLDSSLIAALLVEAGAHVHLFTLDFGPPFAVELPYARKVAAHLGRPLRVVSARPADVQAALLPAAAALEQPFGDGAIVPLYLVGRAASREVDVVFNGEGGDQLFGGWANKPLIAAELYGGPGYDREAAYLATFHRFYGLADQFYTPRAQALVTGAAAGAGGDVGAWVHPALASPGFGSLLHRLRAANLLLKGAQNIAPRAVQSAAACGLRVRMPFFDRALAEWTFALPPEWFLRGACEKYLLKRAAEPYLPPEVVWREKRGMGVSTTHWCLGPLRREVGRWLDPRHLEREGWFQPAAVSTLRSGEDQPGEYRRRRVGEKLWTLVMLQAWLATRERPLTWPTQTAGGRPRTAGERRWTAEVSPVPPVRR